MKKRTIKKILNFFVTVCVIIIFVVGFTYITEYRPKEVESLTLSGKASDTLTLDTEIKVVTYDINHLAKSNLRPENEEIIDTNLQGVVKILSEQMADIILLQQVDYKSDVSYNVNEYRKISDSFNGFSTYAITYKGFVPFPFDNMKGNVKCGQVSLSTFDFVAERIALTNAYNFPKRIFYPKDAILKQEIAIEGTESKLVVLNINIDSEYEEAVITSRLESIKNIMLKEYEKGNYVIVGGNFGKQLKSIKFAENQETSIEENINEIKYISADFLPETWIMAVDESLPTYEEEDGSTSIVDGFILSSNIELKEVKSLNNFEYSNNSPVSIKIKLKK